MKSLGKKIARFFDRKRSGAGTPADRALQESPLLARIQLLLKKGDAIEALKLLQQAGDERKKPGFYYLEGLCLNRVGRHEEARDSFGQELLRNPHHEEARKLFDRLSKAMAKPCTVKVPSLERPWHTSLPHPTLVGIQRALHNFSYRGVPVLKNPFDLALYQMLLWTLKPKTLFEIGSKSGGSALWLGDTLSSFGIDGHVYSIDIVKVETVSHPRVTFREGNGRALQQCLPADFLLSLPRPWLVIEDADHECETSIAVLRFFHPWLRAGEYIVIEDGIISDLTQDPQYNSGPHRALKQFLREHPGDYEIDGDYCDFFGYNMTWCTNGFLKRVDRPKAETASASAVAELEPLVEKDPSAAFVRLNEFKADRVRLPGVDYLRALCFLKQQQPMAAIEALKEELRLFPQNSQAAALLKKLAAEHSPKVKQRDPEFRKLFEMIRPYTMVREARLFSLFTLAKEVCQEDLPGHFVECGVAAGGSSALLAAVIARYSRRPRRLYAFDTFEGMPPPSAADTQKGQPAEKTGWGRGTCAAPETSLREICGKLGVANVVEPIKGLFVDTLPLARNSIGSIALLHMDSDWYESTWSILENLYEQIVPGGRIQVDDYGYWDGCTQALNEFQAKGGRKFELHEIDGSAAWMRK